MIEGKIHVLLFLQFLLLRSYDAGVIRSGYPISQFSRRTPSTLEPRKKSSPLAPNGLDASKYDKSLKTECKIPAVASTKMISSPIEVAAGEVFDCKFVKYQREDTSCDLDHERGFRDAIFQLHKGATLKNCHLGFSQEGVHCMGECRIENSHWQQICDDAVTFHMKTGNATVSGCSFANAGNKALQFNGGGTVYVEKTCFSNVDIAYRSCGGGKTKDKRSVVFTDIEIKGVKTLAGYNTEDGDTVEIKSFTGKPAKHMCQAADAKKSKQKRSEKESEGNKEGEKDKEKSKDKEGDEKKEGEKEKDKSKDKEGDEKKEGEKKKDKSEDKEGDEKKEGEKKKDKSEDKEGDEKKEGEKKKDKSEDKEGDEKKEGEKKKDKSKDKEGDEKKEGEGESNQEVPPGCTIHQSSSGSYPDSSQSKPDNSGSYPDSSASKPDNSGSYPDSSASNPDNSGSKPDSSGSYPDGSDSKTDSSKSKPDSSDSKKDSSKSKPDSSGSYPDSSDSKTDSSKSNTDAYAE